MENNKIRGIIKYNIEGKKYGGRISEFYTKECFLDYIFKHLSPIFKNNETKSICEIGCGKGIVGLYIKKKIEEQKNKVDLTLIDINKKSLESISGKGIKIISKDFLKWYPKNKFDCVVSRLFHHYFSGRLQSKLWIKIYDILKPKGIYVGALPLVKDKQVQKIINGMFKIVNKRTMKDNFVPFYVLRLDEVEKLTIKAGFNQLSIKRYDNYNIDFDMSIFAKGTNLSNLEREELTKELNDYILDCANKSNKIKKYFKIHQDNKGRVLASQPMYIIICRKGSE